MRGEYLLVDFTVLLQRTVVPEQPEEQEPELFEGLCLEPLLHVLELYHVAVGLVRPHQQHDHILQGVVLDILYTDVVIKHQESQYFNRQHKLFIVKGLFQFQREQINEIR